MLDHSTDTTSVKFCPSTPPSAAFADKCAALVNVLWCVFAIALCVKAAAFPRPHTTFPCFAAGSECWWADMNMYNTAVAHQEYRYSPTFAVAFTPFAALPPRIGGLLWSLLNIGALYWSLKVIERDLLPAPWTTLERSGFLLLTLIGSATALWNSQTNTLIFALIAGGAAAVVRRQWWLAALLLAAPVYIKVWPLAAALLFLACWPLPLARRFAICLTGLGILPFLTKPHAVVLGHYSNWIEALAGPMQVRHIYRDAWTIWEVIHPPVHPPTYALLQLGSAGVVLALCLWRWWTAVSVRQTAFFILALWAPWQLLFGPGTERTTICIVVPLMAWGLLEGFQQRRHPLLMSLAVALTTLFTSGDVERALIQPFPLVLAAIPCGVLLYAVWLVQSAWHDPLNRLRGQNPAPVVADSLQFSDFARSLNQAPSRRAA